MAPGFGVDYLLLGRRKAFLVSLLVWAVAASIIGYAIVGGRSCNGGLECLGWIAPMAMGLLLGLSVNLAGAVHVFVLFVRRAFFPGH